MSVRLRRLSKNVVTISKHRGRGCGRQIVATAIEAAWAENAYKIMLLTGRKRGPQGFYEKLGFMACEKQGMILRH